MDFARYLPENSDSKSVFWSATLGVFLPCAILEVGGAAAVYFVLARGRLPASSIPR
jgi:purine-cytosine permease-like protein